jgi:hypothetical protein
MPALRGKPEPYLTDTQVVEVDSAFSPDGKFLDYSSSESGPSELMCGPFQDLAASGRSRPRRGHKARCTRRSCRTSSMKCGGRGSVGK